MDVELKNALSDFSQLNVLVIDDNLLVHDLLTQTLYDLGIQTVRCAQTAFYGLRLCEEMHFNVVICSFNVKSDKDGFHLLEELKFKGHVTKSTVLIFLSGETSESLVNSIIELQPDDFWVKPLSPKHVQERLKYTLQIKNKLFNIYQAIDKSDFSKAIYFAERHLLNEQLSKYHPNILRMKGEALLRILEFSEAESFYQALLREYKHAWVYLGYVKSLLKQDRIAEVEDLIKELTVKPDTRFATHDLLAQYHIENKNYDLAYAEIKKATALSPRNIERNKKSWDLARLTHDYIGQYTATKNIAQNAKNSIHDSPELILNVIRAGIDLACTLSAEQGRNILKQSERYMKSLEDEYQDAHLFKEQLIVAQARIHNAREDNERAQKMVDTHLSLKPSSAIEDNLDKVKVFHALGMREESLILLEAIKKQISGDSLASQVVDNYLQQEINERENIHYTPKHLYDMASEHFDKKRYKPALTSILQAIELAPLNVKFSILQIKILLELEKLNESTVEYQKSALKSVELLKATSFSGKNAEVVKKIIHRWNTITLS